MSFAFLTDIRLDVLPGIPHPGKGQRRSGRVVKDGDSRYTGLRYRSILPTTDVSCFLPTFFLAWLRRRGLLVPGLLQEKRSHRGKH
jgi:hypothetical protein